MRVPSGVIKVASRCSKALIQIRGTGLWLSLLMKNPALEYCNLPGRVPNQRLCYCAVSTQQRPVPAPLCPNLTADDIENLYSWSNTGACVKLFAPGVDIYAACGGASRCATLNDSSYTWASGTRYGPSQPIAMLSLTRQLAFLMHGVCGAVCYVHKYHLAC